MAFHMKFKDIQVQREFERGFGYVMTQHYFHDVPFAEIAQIVYNGGQYTVFDRGAECAIEKLAYGRKWKDFYPNG
jgi:hypothetical protein